LRGARARSSSVGDARGASASSAVAGALACAEATMGREPQRAVARASHNGFAMHNHTADFTPITLDNLDLVTGGYHDPSGPEPQPEHGSGDADGRRQGGTCGRDLGKLISDLFAKGFKFSVPGVK
jgi:hypothetical protein